MPDDQAYHVVATFPSEVDAAISRAMLEVNGIEAVILTDDAGGMLPSMNFLKATRLAVRAGDVSLARELLESSDG